MTVAAATFANAGSVDLGVSFSSSDPGLGSLDFSQSSSGNLGIFTFGPYATTIYWLEAATGVASEVNLTMTSTSGTTGAPFELSVGARMTVAERNYPFDGEPLNSAPGNTWHLYSYDSQNPLFFPYNIAGATLGQLAARVRVSSNLGAGGTITIPLNLGAFTPELLDAWIGYLHVYVWISRKFSTTNPTFPF